MSKKVRGKREEVRGEAVAKPKMTAEQKKLLAAAKSLASDVERAKAITCNAEYVLRELCKACGQTEACKKHLYGLPKVNCRMAAIMGVSIGMIQEERKATLEVTWDLLHCQMAALKAKQKGGAK